MNAAQWQLGRESDNQMKLSHGCNMNLSVRVHAIFAFYLAGNRRDWERWLYDFLMHTYTDTHTGFFLFIKQVQGKTQSLPLFAWISDRSVAASVCEWRKLLSVHWSVCVLWIQSCKFNIKSLFSVCIWCNAVVAVTLGLGWGIKFPLFKFNLCAAFW